MASRRVALAALRVSLSFAGCRCNTEVGQTGAPLAVAPQEAALKVGQTVQATATRDADVTREAEWSSSDPAIATVGDGDTAGLITAVAPGSVTISAAHGGSTATLAVLVTPPTSRSPASPWNPRSSTLRAAPRGP